MNKRIVLQRTAFTIGRYKGCDLELSAGDVAPLHCILTRGSAGVYIRDCGSRSGTKVNGVKIKDAQLRDGDILQVGPVSFEVSLPWKSPADTPVFDAKDKQLERAQQSRRRLVKLAWSLRQRLRRSQQAPSSADPGVDTVRTLPSHLKRQHQLAAEEAERLAREREEAEKALAQRKAELDALEARLAAECEEAERLLLARQEEIDAKQREFEQECLEAEEVLAFRQNELDRQARFLKQQAAEYEKRFREIEATRQQLEMERAAIADETAELRQQIALLEQQISQVRVQHSRDRTAYEHKLRALTLRLQEAESEVENAATVATEDWHKLQIRQQELDCYARHLRRMRDVMQQSARHGNQEEIERLKRSHAVLASVVNDLNYLYNLARQRQEAELQALELALERIADLKLDSFDS
ncbi:MAG: hypothetical protein KatS3mg105_1711 [Gemmatales bacterium]|nr:MAG: hypothetical protein KatS3mg105_1711 [Gemmatales bacterium]